MANGVSVTRDHSAAILKAIAKLGKRDVLVGIPEATSSRPGEPVNNAELAYLLSTGSPADNLPARPFLIPGVEQSLPLITKTMEAGGAAALSGNQKAADETLARAGILASNSVKRYVLDSSHFAPNAPLTVKLKGSDKPLIDKSELLRSVTYVVRDK